MTAHLLFGPFLAALLFAVTKSTGVLLEFIFFYPLFMSFLWIFGASYYYYRRERHGGGPSVPPVIENPPFVSILVPCFDEVSNVLETVGAATRQNYPHFEVIAIDDGSSDQTSGVLHDLMAQYPMLRVATFPPVVRWLQISLPVSASSATT